MKTFTALVLIAFSLLTACTNSSGSGPSVIAFGTGEDDNGKITGKAHSFSIVQTPEIHFGFRSAQGTKATLLHTQISSVGTGGVRRIVGSADGEVSPGSDQFTNTFKPRTLGPGDFHIDVLSGTTSIAEGDVHLY